MRSIPCFNTAPMGRKLVFLTLVLSPFCLSAPCCLGQQQSSNNLPWVESFQGRLLPLSPEQSKFCDLWVERGEDQAAYQKAKSDPFTAQRLGPFDETKYTKELVAILGPNGTITDWVGEVLSRPVGQDSASIGFNFQCGKPPMGFMPVQNARLGLSATHPYPLSDPIIQKLISIPSHSSPARVSGHISIKGQSILLTNGVYSNDFFLMPSFPMQIDNVTFVTIQPRK